MSWFSQLPFSWQTIGLLIASNVFMTVAWYGHLQNSRACAWWARCVLSFARLE
ncbi:MAG: DMT family protein [Brachymonas sp.]|nr:DMT family protein [Brachymonas sp.]